MYHHFVGELDLALAAIRRTAEELRATPEGVLGGPGSPNERVEAYLRRQRDVLRGCPIGRLTMDPEVIASEELRTPVDETLAGCASGSQGSSRRRRSGASSRPRWTARRSQRRSSPRSRAAMCLHARVRLDRRVRRGSSRTAVAACPQLPCSYGCPCGALDLQKRRSLTPFGTVG